MSREERKKPVGMHTGMSYHPHINCKGIGVFILLFVVEVCGKNGLARTIHLYMTICMVIFLLQINRICTVYTYVCIVLANPSHIAHTQACGAG